jgi:hypothetical protein
LGVSRQRVADWKRATRSHDATASTLEPIKEWSRPLLVPDGEWDSVRDALRPPGMPWEARKQP